MGSTGKALPPDHLACYILIDLIFVSDPLTRKLHAGKVFDGFTPVLYS